MLGLKCGMGVGTMTTGAGLAGRCTAMPDPMPPQHFAPKRHLPPQHRNELYEAPWAPCGQYWFSIASGQAHPWHEVAYGMGVAVHARPSIAVGACGTLTGLAILATPAAPAPPDPMAGPAPPDPMAGQHFDPNSHLPPQHRYAPFEAPTEPAGQYWFSCSAAQAHPRHEVAYGMAVAVHPSVLKRPHCAW